MNSSHWFFSMRNKSLMEAHPLLTDVWIDKVWKRCFHKNCFAAEFFRLSRKEKKGIEVDLLTKLNIFSLPSLSKVSWDFLGAATSKNCLLFRALLCLFFESISSRKLGGKKRGFAKICMYKLYHCVCMGYWGRITLINETFNYKKNIYIM